MGKDCIRYLRHPVLHPKVPLLSHCHRIAWMIYLSRAVYIYIWLISTNRFNVYNTWNPFVLCSASKTRSFPTKTRDIWVPGIYIYNIYIFSFWKKVYNIYAIQRNCEFRIGSIPLGRLTWVSLEIHRSRAELMLRKKVANKILREVVGCDLANGGRGGRVTPKDGCFTILRLFQHTFGTHP